MNITKQHFGLDIPKEVKNCLNLIYRITMSYETNTRIGREDYVNVGLAAAMKARETWNSEQGSLFTSYAYPFIKNAIEKEFQCNANALSGGTPYHINNTEGAKEEIQFFNRNMFSLSASRKSLEGISDMTEHRAGMSNTLTFKEKVVASGAWNAESNAEHSEMSEMMEDILKELPEEEQDIVYRRMFDGETFQEIADAKKMTWRAVNYRFHKTLDVLKDKFEETGLSIYA